MKAFTILGAACLLALSLGASADGPPETVSHGARFELKRALWPE